LPRARAIGREAQRLGEDLPIEQCAARIGDAHHHGNIDLPRAARRGAAIGLHNHAKLDRDAAVIPRATATAIGNADQPCIDDHIGQVRRRRVTIARQIHHIGHKPGHRAGHQQIIAARPAASRQQRQGQNHQSAHEPYPLLRLATP
jgi:hypothetical protein